MSLLNRPSDGNYSILIVLYKLLHLEKNGLSSDLIIDLCAPGETGSKDLVLKTLNRWVELGLFERKKNEVSLHSDFTKAPPSENDLATTVRDIVLRQENNSDLWAKEEAHASDLTRALCWMLAQDAWGIRLSGWDDAQKLLQRQLPNNEVVRNDVRWAGFKSWACWLGFAWSTQFPRGGIMIDPTAAVRDVLPRIYGKKKSLEAQDLIKGIAKELPVLDGGRFRKEMEKRLGETTSPDAWKAPAGERLSPSMSFALIRLMYEGILEGERKADSPQRIFLSDGRKPDAPEFTHFVFKK